LRWTHFSVHTSSRAYKGKNQACNELHISAGLGFSVTYFFLSFTASWASGLLSPSVKENANHRQLKICVDIYSFSQAQLAPFKRPHEHLGMVSILSDTDYPWMYCIIVQCCYLLRWEFWERTGKSTSEEERISGGQETSWGMSPAACTRIYPMMHIANQNWWVSTVHETIRNLISVILVHMKTRWRFRNAMRWIVYGAQT